jgi:hypothetical protein
MSARSRADRRDEKANAGGPVGDQVRARTRADHRDVKANAGDPMTENEHVQTNSRKAACVDSNYRPDWIRIGGH